MATTQIQKCGCQELEERRKSPGKRARSSSFCAQSPKAFVDKLDFITSVGYLDGGEARERLGLPGRGPTKVITDLGVMTPDPTTRELTLTQLHPGVTVEQVLSQTGWPLKIADLLQTTAAPTAGELETLRALHRRTKLAHAQGAAA